jgi:hypothetical protein
MNTSSCNEHQLLEALQEGIDVVLSLRRQILEPTGVDREERVETSERSSQPGRAPLHRDHAPAQQAGSWTRPGAPR